MNDDPVEALYWEFDKLRKERTSERDAFKAAVRAALYRSYLDQGNNRAVGGRLSGEQEAVREAAAIWRKYLGNGGTPEMQAAGKRLYALAAAGSDDNVEREYQKALEYIYNCGHTLGVHGCRLTARDALIQAARTARAAGSDERPAAPVCKHGRPIHDCATCDAQFDEDYS